MTTVDTAELGLIAEIVMGTSPPGSSYNHEAIGDPLLNGPTEFGPRHPQPVLFTTEARRYAEPGDLLFCVRGSTTGRMNWADRRYAIGRGVAAIRGRSSAETRFLRAAIEAALPGVLAGATGSTMPNLNVDAMRRIPVPLQADRERVGEIFVALDDLIENNRRRVEVLEEMARGIYREWFVRFRYPGHDDARLVDSPLGPIPDGWAVRSLGELSTNHDRRRRPLSKAQRAERRGSFPYYGAAKLIDRVDGWIFDGEHLLFAEDGTVQTADGFPVLQLVEGKFWANNHTHILEGRGVSTRFLFLACAVQPIAGYVTGAAQPKITQANLNRLALVVATPDIQRRFDEVVDPIFDEWRSLQRSSAPLDGLRSLLLPRLVTGRIDVSHLDLDALTGAATA